jgi:DNA repair protein RecN (Recombination protein N)
MLVTLSIHKIALIDELHLDFGPGLNVFTGETGAGKSILLDAIGLLLGNRSSVEMIRQEADSALVEATFRIHADILHAVRDRFETWGLDAPGEDVIISRTLHRSGRTVCRIDGRLASVQMLKELGGLFVQQHGQHENLDLLRAEAQLALLDIYAGHDSLLSEVKSAYETWRAQKRQLEEAQMDEQTRNQRLDMLRFQIDEIASAALKAGEEDELRTFRNRLQNTDKMMQGVTAALERLDGSDEGPGAATALAEAAAALASIQSFDETLADASTLLETASIHADEAARALADFMSGLEADPTSLNEVEERLQTIRSLERKYGPTIDSVLQYLSDIEFEYQALEQHEATVLERERQVKRASDRLAELSHTLHLRRVEAAAALSTKIEDILHHLSMPEAILKVDVSKRQTESPTHLYQANGADDVSFTFSANKGASPRPMAKIASGGELSRTMLAIKSVLAKLESLDTLIFDEIDAGVSGEAAARVAHQLAMLAQHQQVLCVTHAPQIAAAADLHFAIQKLTDESTTRTHVALLNAAGRVAEIARLVGSDSADETAQLHAKALMEGFRNRLHVSG